MRDLPTIPVYTMDKSWQDPVRWLPIEDPKRWGMTAPPVRPNIARAAPPDSPNCPCWAIAKAPDYAHPKHYSKPYKGPSCGHPAELDYYVGHHTYSHHNYTAEYRAYPACASRLINPPSPPEIPPADADRDARQPALFTVQP